MIGIVKIGSRQNPTTIVKFTKVIFLVNIEILLLAGSRFCLARIAHIHKGLLEIAVTRVEWQSNESFILQIMYKNID